MLTIRIGIKKVVTSAIPCEYTQSSSYTRWTHRRPARVLTQEEYENEETVTKKLSQDAQVEREREDVGSKNLSQTKWRYSTQDKLEGLSTAQRKLKVRKGNKDLKKTNSSYDMLKTVVDANGDVIYTKMDNNDARISMLMTTVKIKNERVRKNLILLEGKRLIREALENNCKLKYLLFTRKEDLEGFKSVLPKSGANIYKMPLREMQLWSDLTNCPGIMGIFTQPTVENFTSPEDSIPLTVICDNIREPGNLGSLLRVCAGVGCQQVILTKGCVNLWDTKVTRSSCGAHFRLQIHTKLDWQEIQEKLNVVGSVFMADNNTLSSNRDCVDDVLTKIQRIPLLPYYSVPFNKDDQTVFIIGGETEGLSEQAYDFVHKSNGGRLNIPLGNGVESLNAGVAAAIILFEIRKQMLMGKKDKLLACTEQ